MTPTSLLRTTLALALAPVLALAVACGDGDSADPSASPSPSATSASPSASPTGSPSASPSSTALPPGFGTDPVTGATTGMGLLTQVRAAAQTGYDRVVFEFESAVPGYTVKYVPKPLTQDPSDLPLALAGTHALMVRMEPAAGVDLSVDPYRLTYTGPASIPTGLTTAVEVARVGDFEAVLTWAIGVQGEQPYKVTTLTGPPRLVVDIATG